MPGQRGATALLMLLLCSFLAQQAHAAHCTAYYPTNLNILIDYSGSMIGEREDYARGVALGVLDALTANGSLQRAGGIGFPYDFRTGDGFNIAISESGISAVIREIQTTRAFESLEGSPLYQHLETTAYALAAMPSEDTNILLVITDGEGSDASMEFRARLALNRLSAEKLFVYPSNVSSPDLETFAADTGSRFYTADIDDQRSMIDTILRPACRNRAPTASLTLSDYELQLGADSPVITFDARASSDDNTPFENLLFEWQFEHRGASSRPTVSGRGSSMAQRVIGFDGRDIGDWTVRLTVLDGSRESHNVEQSFQVRGARPRIRFTATEVVTAGETASVRVDVDDPDGGTVEWSGRLISSPNYDTLPLDLVIDAGSPEVSWTTSSADITQSSTGEMRIADPWVFEVEAEDDEGDTHTDTVTVEVLNARPSFTIEGPAILEASEDPVAGAQLQIVDLEDPDGGTPQITWDVLQSPDNDTDGSSFPAVLGYRTDTSMPVPPFELPTLPSDGGSYIFRATATDDEGEDFSIEHPVFLSVPPVARVEPEQVRLQGLTETLNLDGSDSYDPDSGCAVPVECHTHLEDEVTGVTEGITRWTWSVTGRPPAVSNALPTGPVSEVLSVDGSQATLEVPPGHLDPGNWTFQLTVGDAEGDEHSVEVTVEAVAEGVAPVAQIQAFPPSIGLAEHERAPGGSVRYVIPVELILSARSSFDPDDIRALGPGEPLPANRGITDYHWQLVPPARCTDFSVIAASGAGLDEWLPLPIGTVVTGRCAGTWMVQLEVTDNDRPAHRSSTEFELDIDGCQLPVCLLRPLSEDPVTASPKRGENVLINFMLGGGLEAVASDGDFVTVEIDIFQRDAPTVQVNAGKHQVEFTDQDRVATTWWSGRWQDGEMRPGVYSWRLRVLDPATGITFAEYEELDSIFITDDPVGDLLDCSGLWTRGFPDDRISGAYPCSEHEMPAGLPHADRVRLFALPGFLNERWLNWQMLQWVAEAASDSLQFYAGLSWALPNINIIFTKLDLGTELAVAYSIPTLAGESCPVLVRAGGLAHGRAKFKQIIAHEVAHCLQYLNAYSNSASAKWWVEGSAEWLGSLVYPAADFEHIRPRNFDHQQSVYAHLGDQARYATSLFFRELGDDPGFGISQVLELLGRLARDEASATPAQILAANPAMANSFARFAHRLRARSIGPFEDRWPAPPLTVHHQAAHGRSSFSYWIVGEEDSHETLSDGQREYTVQPWATRFISLYLEKGYRYRIVVENLEGSGAFSRSTSTDASATRPVSEFAVWTDGLAGDYDFLSCSSLDDTFIESAVINVAADGRPYRFRLRTEVLEGTRCP